MSVFPNISARTAAAAVLGHPVRHSLSPLLHNAWLADAGVDAVYLALETTPERFATVIAGCRGGLLRGVNVTIPFKEQALALADQISARAAAAGAANLLIFAEDGHILADNTDGQGMLDAFARQAPAWRPRSGPVLILGAGGAARGALAALISAGVPRVHLVNRSRDRAEGLAHLFPDKVSVWDRSELAPLETLSAVINATSLGLGGGDGPPFDLSRLHSAAVVMDMVYKPLKTRFLSSAEARGLTTVDGLAMLIGQARPSFEQLFGAPPPDVDVRSLALRALGETP